MEIKNNIELEALIQIAKNACLAARTAPKAKGKDNIQFVILTDKEKDLFSEKMENISKEYNHKGFFRDSIGVRQSQILILIGTKTERMKLSPCSLCGYKDCDENEKNNSLCVYTPGDLGIAIGSLVSILSDNRVDNRIMYSAGVTALRTKLFSDDIKIVFGIPLSATGKNPFFDRKTV